MGSQAELNNTDYKKELTSFSDALKTISGFVGGRLREIFGCDDETKVESGFGLCKWSEKRVDSHQHKPHGVEHIIRKGFLQLN